MTPAAVSAEEQEDLPLSVWIGLIAMIVGNFMALLDIQIVASSIGAIQAGVSASNDEISWVQTAYLIAEVIGIPLSGFMARALGTRLLFCISASGFAVTSGLCAFSWNIDSLMVFRALQGLFGAPMIPLTMATFMVVVPARHRNRGLLTVAAVSMMAPSIGPTLGGYISEHLGWRALFWINLAPAILATVIVWRNLRSLKGGEFNLLKRIDAPGLIGMSLFLGGFEYFLEEGPSNGWFESQELFIVAIVALLGAALFFRRIFTYDNPIVDMRPFYIPTYAICSSLSFMVGVALFAPVFLTPLFLTSVRGYNSFQTGEVMFVQGVTMLFASPMMLVVTRLITDPRVVSTLGMFITALACFLQSNLTAQASFPDFVWPQILRGVGLIFAYGSLLSPALAALPVELTHAGASLFNTVRNIGGAFGIAFMTTLQMHAFALHKQELRAALDPQNPHVQQMISGMQGYLEQTGARDPARQSLMDYAGILDREALVMAFNDQFLFLTILMVGAGVVMVFITVFGKPMPRIGEFGGGEKPKASEQIALQYEAHP